MATKRPPEWSRCSPVSSATFAALLILSLLACGRAAEEPATKSESPAGAQTSPAQVAPAKENPAAKEEPAKSVEAAPVLRIETGMHTADIWEISADATEYFGVPIEEPYKSEHYRY